MKKLLFILLCLPMIGFGQIIIDNNAPYDNPSGLINNIWLGGGITSNHSFQGNSAQIGWFNAINTTLGIDSGIVISTGDIYSLDPINGSTFPSIANIVLDPDLLNIATSVPALIGQTFSVSSINDVAILEFDFTPTSDSFNFRYVFGSEDYLEWENSSFNDVFGFFISGPGISGPYSAPSIHPNGSMNLAIVPGSNPPLPITISSVNSVTPINQQYFVDNSSGLGSIAVADGLTTVFTSNVLVQCNELYHIRIAIADGADVSGNSFIFLGADSFTSPSLIQTHIPDNNFESYLESNCMGNGIFGDNSVSTINISSIVNLNIGGLSISDLTGIEDFDSLQYLDCSNNNLTDLDISNNTQLLNLQCEANMLTDLTFNNSLVSLDCFNNQLSSLDFSNNSDLTFLNCSYNSLIWLDLRNGNNQSLINPNFTGNPHLSCLNVDDPPASDDDWPWDDPWSVYSTSCDPINSWNCVGNDCLGDSTGQGMYTVLGDCQNSCGVSSVLDNNNPAKELIKVIDILGRHTEHTKETILFYIYDDGTVEKKIIIE